MDNQREIQSHHGQAGSLNGGSPPSAESVEYVKQYIVASAESADRVRFVLLVLITASVLAFFAFWNSYGEGWLNSRLRVATNALQFYKEGDSKDIYRDDKSFEQFVWPRFFDQETYAALPDQEKEEYKVARREDFERAREYVKRSFVTQSRFADVEHLRTYVERLEKVRTERVLSITVPFFGIVFDINDLGIFAGITFVIALLLFRFSLLRELRNLRLVFIQAKSVEHLRLCYDMLAMQQVLTIPPQVDRHQSDRTWITNLRDGSWRYVPMLLYVLPLLVHLVIFINDFKTYGPFVKTFPGTVFGLGVSAFLLGVNALLTVLCFYLGWKVDKTWRNHANFILNNSDPPQPRVEDEPSA